MPPLTVPGPTIKPDQPAPCGCRLARDSDTARLRLWFCRTHAAAFELLDALQSAARALDQVARGESAVNGGSETVTLACTRAQAAIAKAKERYWW